MRNKLRYCALIMASVLAGWLFTPGFLAGSSARAADTARENLASYRDKNRVLVVFAPGQSDAHYRQQTALLRGSERGMKERDLVLLFAGSDTSALRQRFRIEKSQFHVLLIGKDGHVAVRADHPLSPDMLFRVIDAMPMRRDEMRRQRAGKKP